MKVMTKRSISAIVTFILTSFAALAAHAQYLPLSGGTLSGTLVAPYPDVLSSAYANIGGISGASLNSTYGLNNSGKMLVGWNYGSGSGETDLITNRGAGGTGGLSIYDFANSTFVLTKIFGVDGSGNGSFTGGLTAASTTWLSGDGFATYWKATTGVQGFFTADTKGGNTLTAAATTNSTSGNDAQAATFVAYGSSNNASTTAVTVGFDSEVVSLSGYGGYILNLTDVTNGSGVQAPLINPWSCFCGGSSASLEVATGGINTNTYAPNGLTIGTVNNISTLLYLVGCGGTGNFACANNTRTTQAFTGIEFNAVALATSCGTPISTHCGTGSGGVAVDMPSFAEFRWMTNISTAGLEVWGSQYGLSIANASATCSHSPLTSGESVYCSSDQTLKHGISDAKAALPYLDSFRVRQYTENATGQTVTHGVIAQEIKAIHPELVRAQVDGKLAVAQPSEWLLIKAIQELKANENAQEKQIARLTKEVTSLRIRVRKSGTQR